MKGERLGEFEEFTLLAIGALGTDTYAVPIQRYVEKATGRANPTVAGLAEQADVLYDKTDDELLDTVLLGGAAETEHLEIALYEDLIIQARAMGEQQVVSLLEQNLEQEQHTLEEVRRASQQLAQGPGRLQPSTVSDSSETLVP